MKVGFGSADVTPCIGMEKPGSLCKAYHVAFHDPCYAKAMVIEGDGQRVALVGLDALSVKHSVVEAARALIEEKTGIAPANVMVGASHSHSAGPGMGPMPGDFADSFDPELCEDMAQNRGTAPDPCYLEYLSKQIASAVIIADQTKQDAKLAVGSGEEPTVAFNRRFIMKDGAQQTHPGKGNPNIVGFAGPADPEVGVLSAWTPEGGFLGCTVNFTCHGTTGNTGISADWIYWLRKCITGGMGGGEVVFLNGACGDVTQVNNVSLQESEFGPKWSRRVGYKVGAEALKVLSMAEPTELGPICAARQTIMLEPREITEEMFETELEYVKNETCDDFGYIFHRDIVLLHEWNKIEPQVPCEIQAIQVGPVGFVANPGEYFCQYGLNIKERSQFPLTYVVELANGCIGYVPTPDAMGENGGGYEQKHAMSSKLAVEAGQMIEDASVELLARLTPSDIPEPPQAPVNLTGWGVGKSKTQK